MDAVKWRGYGKAPAVTNDERKQVALQAFLRDLPGLYEQRAGQFVAYHGERQIGFGVHKHLLYKDCTDSGARPRGVRRLLPRADGNGNVGGPSGVSGCI